MTHTPTPRRRAALAALIIALLTLSLARPLLAADERPNIVFIISDDHDNEHLGFMGNTFVHTPRIDALATRGAVFTTAHLPMSRCHPTLASFLSGRWPHQTGIYYNFGSKPLDPTNSLPNLLKNAGYATYVEGKYWEGDVRAMGFTHGAGKSANTFVRKDQDELFAFIDKVGGKKPLFIWWAPMIPHTPHNPPKRYTDLFDGKPIPVPSYVKEADDADKPKGKKRGGSGFEDKERVSFAMEAWLDDGVGQLVDKLKSKGLHDNTLYVFVIDNGWCNGLVSKGSPFEKGVRTPIFFSWPAKIKPNQRFDDLVSTLDLYPTMLDYAGVEVPKAAAGRSLRPAIDGKPMEMRDELYGAIYPAFATKGDERPERDVYALYVRTKKWKYILYLQDVTQDRSGDYFRIQNILTDFPTRKAGDEDLYDLESDPHELHDLAAKAESAAQLKAFKTKVLKWWSDTGGKALNAPQ